MTAQEIFDKVTNHLLTQNKQSLGSIDSRDGDGCLYKSPDGLSCAVGCLFPESYDTSGFEGDVVSETSVTDHLLGIGVISKNDREDYDSKPYIALVKIKNPISLLGELQQLHDTYESSKWPEKLRLLSEEYGLQFNPNLKPSNP